MRISPLGIFGHALPPTTLARLAWRDATLTHPHPVCGVASAVFALAIARAVATGDPAAAIADFMLEQAKSLTPDEVVESPGPRCAPAAWEEARAAAADTLIAARVAAPVMAPDRMGWVLVALRLAAYQLHHAESVEAGIVDTVQRGGDSDTNGAIVGALLGAVYGRDAIPWAWRDRVLTCRPMPGLPGVHQPRPSESWPIDVLVLAEVLLGSAWG
jgi:ADP-ribosylglycohydrolase